MSRAEQICAACGLGRARGSALGIAARRFVWICAVLAVMVSTVLGSVSGYALGSGYTDMAIPTGRGFAIGWAFLVGLLALLKPAVAIEIAASCLTNRAVVGAGVVWFTFLVFNWFLISSVGAVYLTGLRITYGVVGLSMTVLLIEVVSGYLPAFVYMTRPAPGSPVSDARRAQVVVPPPPSVTPVVDEVPEQQAFDANVERDALDVISEMSLPILNNFADLFEYVERSGCPPGLRLHAEGGLVASQATLAHIFNVSKSTINARIRKAHGAGLIVASVSARETRIMRVVGDPTT